MTTLEQLEAAVQRGAAWLDEHEPRWWQRVDTERLNLRSSYDCVAGQLCSEGYSSLLLLHHARWSSFDLGFNVYGDIVGPDAAQRDASFNVLQDLWLKAIEERRVQEQRQEVTS